MGEGKGEDALALITGAFAKLDPDESIEISRDDALALGRGLGLNKNSLQSLADNFADTTPCASPASSSATS